MSTDRDATRDIEQQLATVIAFPAGRVTKPKAVGPGQSGSAAEGIQLDAGHAASPFLSVLKSPAASVAVVDELRALNPGASLVAQTVITNVAESIQAARASGISISGLDVIAGLMVAVATIIVRLTKAPGQIAAAEAAANFMVKQAVDIAAKDRASAG